MCTLGTQLLKGKSLACLVGKSRTGLRIGKQMIEAITQYHCQHIKDNLAIACGTELLELPASTFHLLIVLLNLGTLFVMPHNPRGAQSLIRCDQDDIIGPLLLAIPKANHAGVQRHLTLRPHMLNAVHPGNALEFIPLSFWYDVPLTSR